MSEPVDVDLWTWDLDVDAPLLAHFQSLLNDDERARAARFVHERHQRRFAAGRGRLREILGRYLDVPAQTVAFAYGDHGKPELASPGPSALAFNLSHTEAFAALVVSKGVDIGVDVELAHPVKEDIAGRFFSVPEQEALAALPDAEQTRAFHRCWTRKEALVKALGDGLSAPLDAFAVSIEADAPARLTWLKDDPSGVERWAMSHFEPRPDVIGAIAAMTDGRPLQIRLQVWRKT